MIEDDADERWTQERRAELVEKERRGEQLLASERREMALDEVGP